MSESNINIKTSHCKNNQNNNNQNKNHSKESTFVIKLSSRDPSIKSKICLIWGSSMTMIKVYLIEKKISSESHTFFIFLSKPHKQIFTNL